MELSSEEKRQIYRHILADTDQGPFFAYLDHMEHKDQEDPEKYDDVSLEYGISLAAKYTEFKSNKAVQGIKIIGEHIDFLEKNLARSLIIKAKVLIGDLKLINVLSSDDMYEKLNEASSFALRLKSWLLETKGAVEQLQEVIDINAVITSQMTMFIGSLAENINSLAEDTDKLENSIIEIHRGESRSSNTMDTLRQDWSHPNCWTKFTSQKIVKEQAEAAVKKLDEYEKVLLIFYTLTKRYPVGSIFSLSDNPQPTGPLPMVYDYKIEKVQSNLLQAIVCVVYPKGQMREIKLTNFIPLTDSEVFGEKEGLERETPAEDTIPDGPETQVPEKSAMISSLSDLDLL